MIIRLYGIHGYVVPLPRVLPQLKSQLQESEEKRHSLSLEFSNKKRILTNIIESIHISNPK
jgi:hypothetical protein